MSSAQKIIQAAAGNAAGEGEYIEDLFSTYLYTGTGASQTITNGIDLDGEGGLVWFKGRTGTVNHALYDTERGTSGGYGIGLISNTTGAEITGSTNYLTTFNSNGFTTSSNGSGTYTDGWCSWTFRKAPKFFDVVTYTGNATSGRTISHNLGSVPGCIIVKKTDNASNWVVYHRGNTASPETDYLRLNTTNATTDDVSIWNDTAPTSSVFTVGNGGEVNSNNASYVAYLFAHNDGDGGFGENADQDIIKCGSYTGGTSGNEINLGFEPQWLLIKPATLGDHWLIFDNMRGLTAGDGDKNLYPNLSNAEAYGGGDLIPTSTGFTLTDTHNSTNGSHTYIYIAIRRGPMKTPEDATELFSVKTSQPENNGYWTHPHLLDMSFYKFSGSQDWGWQDRLRGQPDLSSSSTSAENGLVGNNYWDQQTGWFNTSPGDGNYTSWGFRRAPGFFEVVAYTGNGQRPRTVSHNLGVVPELMFIKNRDDTQNWLVYVDSLGGTKKLYLNTSAAVATASIDDFNNTDAEATQFTLGNDGRCNASGQDFIAYLFATLPGVSKVGSYTGNGTSQTIDCGFSAGARFVLIKRTDSTGDWRLYDSERGIVAGADPHFKLNTTADENSGTDDIDPVSSGFSVTNNSNVNTNSAEYIFLAIA